MHNLELSEEQTMILETVRKLVTDVAGPKALEHDEHGQFVRGSFDALAELGLLGVAVEEKHGGAGLGMLALVVALEEIGKGCGSTARLLLSQCGLCGMALAGLDGAADTLGELLVGSAIGSYVGPEHGIIAQKDGDGFALSGTCECATAAAEANWLCVAATLDGAPALFLMPAAGAKVDAIAPLGYRASAPARITFAKSRVDGSTLCASGDAAKQAFARAQVAALIGAAAIATGSAFASVEHSRRHTEERIAFGKPLARQQAVGHKLVEGMRRASAARHLTWHAARLFDLGQDALDVARMAKLTAVDAALLAADEGIQVHGGYGFTVEYHVERHYRDAKTLEVLDGGSSSLRDALTAALATR
ncbi:MAG: acyl-CoA dehydrogenase family protein [Planctomycetota bacterium]